MAERGLVDRRAALLGERVEEANEARPVMTGDDLADLRRQAIAVGEGEPVAHVRGDDAR